MDSKVLDKLQALCSGRECCVSELREKALKLLSGDEEGAEEIVSKLISDGYADDSRYAEAFARDKAYISGWGPIKISYMLRTKGIADAVIRKALNEVDNDRAEARMTKVLQTKYNAIKDDPQWRLKLIKFGLTRGYDYDSVSEFLAKL